MKIKYTLAALAALTVGANAATIVGLAGSVNNQANFTATAGITFTTGTLGLETVLSSIDIGGRTTGTSADVVSIAVFADLDQDSTTYDLGASLATASNTQALATGINTFNFSGLTLADNTVYTVVFTNVTTPTNNVGFGLNNGASNAGTQIFQNNGTAAFAASHEAAITVNTTAVPEPSSTALLGLGGLALILRRRK